MKKGKCTSVCRTGKLSTISREEENKEIVHGSEKRVSHRELQGEETGTAKPGTLEIGRLVGTKLFPVTVDISTRTVFVTWFYDSPKWLLLSSDR